MSGSRPTYSRVTYGAIFVLVVAVIAWTWWNKQIGEKEIGAAFLALLGTFLGAMLAFRLNEDREENKLAKERRAALNRVLFVLIRQHNATQQLLKEFDAYTTPFDKAFNLPALLPPDYTDLDHNFTDLEFLLETPNADALFRLAVEQERFRQMLESLRVRNKFYVEEIQPAISRLSLNGREITSTQAAQLMGDRLFGGAIAGAKIAYEHVTACAKSVPAMHAEFLQLAKAMYPKHKFAVYENVA
jgi:hypothetical protein